MTIAFRLVTFFRRQSSSLSIDKRMCCINLQFDQMQQCLGPGEFQQLLDDSPEILLNACGVAACEVKRVSLEC